MATLPSPDDMLAQLRRREVLRDDFVQRAHDWAVERAGSAEAVVVEHPRDEPAILALGVPCGDCLTLVYTTEGGHHVRFGAEAGRHWAALITAHCRRPAA